MRQRQEIAVATYANGIPWDESLYEYEIKRQASRMHESFARMGGLLIVMKEHVAHGEWLRKLEQLGIPADTASRAMLIAQRLGKLPPESADRLVALVPAQTKLLEVLGIPPQELNQLIDGGEVGGKSLDDLSKLSRAELREQIQDLKARLEAKDQRAKEQEDKIEKKDAALRKLNRQLKDAPVDERIERLRNAVNRCAVGITTKICAYEESPKAEPVDSLKTHMLALVDETDPEVAQGDHRAFMAGVIDDLIHELHLLRDHELLDLQQVKTRKR